MTIDSGETLFYVSTIIVPGFLLRIVYNCVFPARGQTENKEFFISVSFGLLSFYISSLFYEISLFTVNSIRLAHLLNSILAIILISILFYLISKLIRIEKIEKVLSDKIINFYPSSWDYMFRKSDSHIFEITLKNKEKIYGLYGSNSFAPVKYNDKDIYLEKTYSLDSKNRLVEDCDVNGIYISGDEIVSIIDLKKGKKE